MIIDVIQLWKQLCFHGCTRSITRVSLRYIVAIVLELTSIRFKKLQMERSNKYFCRFVFLNKQDLWPSTNILCCTTVVFLKAQRLPNVFAETEITSRLK